MQRLPSWFRLSLTTDDRFTDVHQQVKGQALHTVCQSARCPNRHDCWNRGTATLMILGDICTRSCRFCAVPSGRPLPLDLDEPRRVGEAVKAMKLRHVVLTSVNRDDLEDGGSGLFAETVRSIRQTLPEASIEVLTPDFEGSEEAVATVLRAGADVFSHNLETVSRLQPVIRSQASYGRSLAVLRLAARWGPRPVVKSAVMVGLGETEAELWQALEDLLAVGCDVLALGQYLRPTREHMPVARYVDPNTFRRYGETARRMGFKAVAAGPLVRSSFRADELLEEARLAVSLAS